MDFFSVLSSVPRPVTPERRSQSEDRFATPRASRTRQPAPSLREGRACSCAASQRRRFRENELGVGLTPIATGSSTAHSVRSESFNLTAAHRDRTSHRGLGRPHHPVPGGIYAASTTANSRPPLDGRTPPSTCRPPGRGRQPPVPAPRAAPAPPPSKRVASDVPTTAPAAEETSSTTSPERSSASSGTPT